MLKVPQIRIAGLLKSSAADGPGIRSVLFFRGCSRNCPHCHNAELQSKDGGVEYSIDELLKLLWENCRSKKLTISGGEPLEQSEALYELACALNRDCFDLCVYTGAEMSEVPQKLLHELHYIKTGSYIEALRTFDTPFVGSSNQKFTVLF